jgi:nitrilase
MITLREHLQPLQRYHHYNLGVQVHFAAWPVFDSIAAGAPPHFSSDTQILVTRFAALEGQMFVVSSTQVISPKGAEIMG